MKKISVFVICMLSVALVSCTGAGGNKSEEVKTPIEVANEAPEEAGGTDFLKNYEEFVNQEVEKLEKTPTSQTAEESVAAATAFFAEFGDPTAMDMTPEALTKFKELGSKHANALDKIVKTGKK